MDNRAPPPPLFPTPLPPLIAPNIPVYATQTIPPSEPPLSWIGQGMQGQAVFFNLSINGQEIIFIIQNQNFLAQLITEGIILAMDNYMNHMWMANVLDPLAPAIAPTLFYNMHAQWTLPHHFNLLLNMNQVFNLPFFTPHETINTNPLFFPWQPQQTQAPQTPQMPMQMDNPQPAPPQAQGEMEAHITSSQKSQVCEEQPL